MLRTCFFLLTFYPYTAFCTLVGLSFGFLCGADRLHNFNRRWARGCLWLGGVRLIVEGAENLPTDRPVIYMSNHQGNFDIPVLFAGVTTQFRWLAKAELFRIPFFGRIMRVAGYIPVERSDRKKALTSMNEAARRVANGTSVMVFPEGTRSPDGRLQPFKRGGFMLALQAKVEIVPIAIDGSAAIMSKESFFVRGGEIRMRIFPPITTADKNFRESGALMGEVARLIASGVTEPTLPCQD